MKPVEASTILPKLERLTTTLIALTPEDWMGSGLEIKRKLVNSETHEPIFLYVDRLELIAHLTRITNVKRIQCLTSNLKENLEATQ